MVGEDEMYMSDRVQRAQGMLIKYFSFVVLYLGISLLKFESRPSFYFVSFPGGYSVVLDRCFVLRLYCPCATM